MIHSATPQHDVHSSGTTPVKDASSVCPKCHTWTRDCERHQCSELHSNPTHNPQSRQSSDSSLSTCSSTDEERGSRGDKEELQAFLHELYWPAVEEEEPNNNSDEDGSVDVVEAQPVQL